MQEPSVLSWKKEAKEEEEEKGQEGRKDLWEKVSSKLLLRRLKWNNNSGKRDEEEASNFSQAVPGLNERKRERSNIITKTKASSGLPAAHRKKGIHKHNRSLKAASSSLLLRFLYHGRTKNISMCFGFRSSQHLKKEKTLIRRKNSSLWFAVHLFCCCSISPSTLSPSKNRNKKEQNHPNPSSLRRKRRKFIQSFIDVKHDSKLTTTCNRRAGRTIVKRKKKESWSENWTLF